MRTYDKVEIVLRIALDMLSSARGVSLRDIRLNYSGKPLSRGTAERYRNTLKRVFPQFEEVNPHHNPRRWRLSKKPLRERKTSNRGLSTLADAAATRQSADMHQLAKRAESKLQSLTEKARQTGACGNAGRFGRKNFPRSPLGQ
jgi:hypothetical protein